MIELALTDRSNQTILSRIPSDASRSKWIRGLNATILVTSIQPYYLTTKSRTMRILSANIGTTNVVFDNSMWTGKEYVYVNGNLVSKKFSWFGTDHAFQVTEDGVTVNYVLTTGYNGWGITARLTRNGVMVVDTSCESASWI